MEIVKKRVKYVLLIIGLAIAVAVAAKFAKQEGEVTSFKPEFEEGQVQTTSEGSVEKGIKIPGYTTIPVNAGETEVDIDLYNPDENDVYFQVTFILNKEEEQIYQSKLIKPGDHLYTITLDRALEAGTYDLMIKYDTFAMDESYSPRNGASVNCVLEVK